MSGIVSNNGEETPAPDLHIVHDGPRWSIEAQTEGAFLFLREHLKHRDASHTGKPFSVDAALANELVSEARKASLKVRYCGPNKTYLF